RSRPRIMEQLVNQAMEEECDRLIVIGGDGTLHRAINALHRQNALTRLALGVVPAGTCNDFARAMGLHPKRLDEALRVACAESVRPTDPGRLTAGNEETLLINTAGF